MYIRKKHTSKNFQLQSRQLQELRDYAQKLADSDGEPATREDLSLLIQANRIGHTLLFILNKTSDDYD